MRGTTIAAAIVIIACGKDALVTAPLAVPGSVRGDVEALGETYPQVVISQIYGGGGNSGATLKNDFIEIHNNGTTDVPLTGWSVQYASSAGSSWQVTPLHGTLAPGQYHLILEAKGTGGTQDLPLPHDDSGNVAMSATSGKVALVRNTTALTCGASGSSCGGFDVVADLIGFGTAASVFEGVSPTANLANTTAALRRNSGCMDTDNNRRIVGTPPIDSSDFAIGAPTPRNSASTAFICPDAAPRVASVTPVSAGILTDPPNLAVIFNEPVNLTDDWFRLVCSSTGAHTSAAIGGPQKFSLTELGDFAPGETCTATVAAASVRDQDAGDPPDAMTGDFSWTFKTEGEPFVLPETHFTEIHYDNAGDDVDEQIEIEGPANTDLSGWSIALYNGGSGLVYDTKPLTGTIPAGCGERGAVAVSFFSIQNGSPDGMALVHDGAVVQFLSYEGTFAANDGPAAGMISTDIKAEESSGSSAISSLQLNGKTGRWTVRRRNFGRCNSLPLPPYDMTFSGRLPISDPALPVGFEDQIFATMLDTLGATVPTTFAWSSDTPELASIDERGVMHALAAGQAVFRATAANGTSVTYSLPTTVATLGGTADYRGNAEFGIPTDADASDDFIITRDQYTISYSRTRNTPNWVSYEFDATHFQAPGGDNIDRCDCFTHDPALPPSFTHLTTADYTGAGAFAGYGIDRGHMARSFDFTSGSLDNARSYYLSNIIPQAAAVNQGPWKLLEDSLGNLARFDGKEVYIIDGVAGNKGTVKDEGKIVIPTSVWKIVIVLPVNHGLADVHDFNDIDDIIAVVMPNDPTVNADWKTYKTTVDEVERVSGYDVLSLLPDKLEQAVENNDVLAAKKLNGAVTLVRGLATAGLNAGQANSLVAKISAAQNQLGMGNTGAAANQLRALLNELDAMVASGRLTSADAQPLQTMITQIIDSLTT